MSNRNAWSAPRVFDHADLPMPFTAAQIAEKLQGEVVGDGSVQLLGVAQADRARAGELTFAENASYFAAAEQSQAAAILVAGPLVSSRKNPIWVGQCHRALARL